MIELINEIDVLLQSLERYKIVSMSYGLKPHDVEMKRKDEIALYQKRKMLNELYEKEKGNKIDVNEKSYKLTEIA